MQGQSQTTFKVQQETINLRLIKHKKDQRRQAIMVIQSNKRAERYLGNENHKDQIPTKDRLLTLFRNNI